MTFPRRAAPPTLPPAGSPGRRWQRAAALLGLLGWALGVPAGGAAPAAPVDFARDIQPLLERHCWECHGPARAKSDLRLDSRAAALRGGQELGPALKPGDGAGSPMVRLAAGLVAGKEMPARGERLSPAQVGLLQAWVDQGAAWPDQAALDPVRSHCAFQPVKRPPVPAVPPPLPPAGHPVDAFIRERLAGAGLG
ncbi:MAG: c-type cytochrome domain-containing protein, partial [Verrucomicrobiota bacterium]